MSSKLRFALDFGPLLVFFVCFKLAGVFAATVSLMIATLLALALTYALERKLAVMALVSGVAVGIFGTLTILLHDEQFIKIKPTLVNLLFAAILLIGLGFRKSLLKYVLNHAFQLTERGWRILTLRWGLFFLLLAGLNEVIWRNYSTEFWVNFKVFGVLTLSMLFTAMQIPLVRQEWVEENPS